MKGIEVRKKKVKIKKRRGSRGRDKKFKVKKYGDVNGPIWASRIIVHLVKLSRGSTYIEVVLRDYVALEDVGLIPSGMDQQENSRRLKYLVSVGGRGESLFCRKWLGILWV